MTDPAAAQKAPRAEWAHERADRMVAEIKAAMGVRGALKALAAEVRRMQADRLGAGRCVVTTHGLRAALEIADAE